MDQREGTQKTGKKELQQSNLMCFYANGIWKCTACITQCVKSMSVCVFLLCSVFDCIC